MPNIPILIIEDTLKFKKGQIIESYQKLDEGVTVKKDYIGKSKFISLNENLSSEDQKKVREIVRLQLKQLLWNMYTKSGILINN